MTQPRINPHMLTPTSKKWKDARFAGGKVYLAIFTPSGHRSRKIFKRASEAKKYAEKLLGVCVRLYDETMAALAPEGPAQTLTPSLSPQGEGEQEAG